MRKLEGGFINEVILDDDGIVKKTFQNDGIVGISSSRRIANEFRALSIFGGTIAPKLVGRNNSILYQEFIDGESYELKARRGEKVFGIAGKILAKIHNRYILPAFSQDSQYYTRFKSAISLAEPILRSENLHPAFVISPQILDEWGIRYIHGDFWLGNVLGITGKDPKIIDWEFSGIRSPFEDFSIADLWIFREFPGSEDEFWLGYGNKPDQNTINSFLIFRCVEFLATTTLGQYILEENDGFYHNKVGVLRTLI